MDKVRIVSNYYNVKCKLYLYLREFGIFSQIVE